MQKIIHSNGRQHRKLALLANEALATAAQASSAKALYDQARSDAVVAIKEAFPDLKRGDVLVFTGGRVEGQDAIERKLDDHAFACTVDKRYDSPSEAIAKLIEQGVLKLDLAVASKVFGASVVSESRSPGSLKFVPASVEQEQEQKQAVNQ